MRKQFIKVYKQASEYLETSDSITEAKLISFENSLQRKSGELRALDDEVQEEIDEDRVEKDVEESVEFLEPLDELLASLTLKLGELRLSKTANDSSSVLGYATVSTNSFENVKCKLPKLEIPPFSGEPLDWQGFWDRFNLSINCNESVSDVDKFNYLLRFLSGKALSCVKGLTCPLRITNRPLVF